MAKSPRTEQQKPVRTELTKQLRLMLGEGMIDIEPDPEHINLAIDLAFDQIRRRSSNAKEEAYVFLELQADVNQYTLPKEFADVREVFRRGTSGLNTGGGTQIDPFSLAFNNLYLLRSGDQGGLATYHLFADYQETVGRLFGLYINYHYDPVTRVLSLMRRPRANETILLWVYKNRTEEELWCDEYLRPWIRDYSLAQTKLMMAEARTLFASIPGPGGGTTLNGSELKADAMQRILELEEEIRNLLDGSQPMWFVIR